MFPEQFTIDEIRWAAHQLPMRVEKRPEGRGLVRRVSFEVHAQHVSSVMTESTRKIDIDKAVLNGVKRQLADTLAAELQKRMREDRQKPARSPHFEARRRWIERMQAVFGNPELRAMVDDLLEKAGHAQG